MKFYGPASKKGAAKESARKSEHAYDAKLHGSKDGLPTLHHETTPVAGAVPSKTMHELADELHPVKRKRGY